MRFLTELYSNPGGRDPNEDAVGAYTNEQFRAWIAADGLGGHLAGEVASAEAAKTISQTISDCNEMDQNFVENAFRKINNAICDLNGPLTTAVCAFSDGKTLYYGNNGDSRFIFFRKKKAILHTNDHSLAFLAYQTGQIQYDEIPSHPAQNRLFHSMGNETDFYGEFYEPIDLMPGDAFILCTDGFWELVTESEMERSLNISNNAEEWMSIMLGELEPRLKPTSDNYTAVCVIIRED